MKSKFNKSHLLVIFICLAFFFLFISQNVTANDYQFKTMWPRLEHDWYFPAGALGADSSDSVYLCDGNSIQKITSNGMVITRWGKYGSENGQFISPRAIATDSYNNVYVADHYNHRIQKFTSNGVFITKWGSRFAANGFNEPNSVAIDKMNNVYVADRLNRILKFTPEGEFIKKWEIEENDDGGLTSTSIFGC